MPEIINKGSVTYKGTEYFSNEVEIEYGGEWKDLTGVKSTTFVEPAYKDDIIPWKFVWNNPNASAAALVPFKDILDTKSVFVVGTFKQDGVVKTPTTTSPAVTYTIPTIPPGGSVIIEFNVKVL